MTIGAGQTSDQTVGNIIDRMYMQWLAPPDGQFAQSLLGADVVDDSTQSIQMGAFLIQEDELLMRQGAIIELDEELMRVIDYDGSSKVVTVLRGVYSTKATSHVVPLLVNLNPPYPRATMFEAIADNIIQLYPKLFTASEVLVSPVTDRVYSLPDELAVEVTSAWPGDFTSTINIHGRIVDFHPMVGGRSFIANVGTAGTIWLRYKRRMGKATSEADTLYDLGVDERWVNIVLAGAAADSIAGRDIPQARTEWIQSVLEAENIPVGTRMSISGGLRQYRNMLLLDAEREMKAEYKPKIRMKQAFEEATG